MWTCLFIPAATIADARRIGALVEAGKIKPQPHWATREACDLFIDSLPAGGSVQYLATMVSVRLPERAPVYVPAPEPAWRFDSLGDVAATVAVFASIWAVGIASCWSALA